MGLMVLPAAFDDRTVTLDAPEQLAKIAGLLASRTRVAILAELARANAPLNINEVARRVGVNASPVRTHLELLTSDGLIEEVRAPAGRERNFVTRLTRVFLALEGVNRTTPPAAKGPPPREIVKLEKKLAALAHDQEVLTRKIGRIRAQIAEAWAAEITAGGRERPPKA